MYFCQKIIRRFCALLCDVSNSMRCEWAGDRDRVQRRVQQAAGALGRITGAVVFFWAFYNGYRGRIFNPRRNFKFNASTTKGPAGFQSAWILFETKSLKRLEALTPKTFPEEEVLKKESRRVLWNQIFNAAVESIGKPYKYIEFTCYTPTKRQLTSYMENGGESWSMQEDGRLWTYELVCSVLGFTWTDSVRRKSIYR